MNLGALPARHREYDAPGLTIEQQITATAPRSAA